MQRFCHDGCLLSENYDAMKRLSYLLLLFAFACSADKTDEVMLRIKNTNNFPYDKVVVISPSNEHDYGMLKMSSFSEYKMFSEMYRYAYIRVEVNGKEYILQPIDYVGETPLENGRYTFSLEVNIEQEGYSGLSYTLIKD